MPLLTPAIRLTPRCANAELNRLNSPETCSFQGYSKGETISMVTQGVWQVHRGVVQLSTLTSNGEEILLGWAGKETFFGRWMTVLEVYQATALSDVELQWYAVSEIEVSPRLCQIVLPQLLRRMRQTEAMLAISGQRRVEERLHRLLWLLKQETGQPTSQGTRLGIRLTHQNIASAINTTRVTVTRLLNQLQREGLIGFDRDRHIILHDPQFPPILEW